MQELWCIRSTLTEGRGNCSWPMAYCMLCFLQNIKSCTCHCWWTYHTPCHAWIGPWPWWVILQGRSRKSNSKEMKTCVILFKALKYTLRCWTLTLHTCNEVYCCEQHDYGRNFRNESGSKDFKKRTEFLDYFWPVKRFLRYHTLTLKEEYIQTCQDEDGIVVICIYTTLWFTCVGLANICVGNKHISGSTIDMTVGLTCSVICLWVLLLHHTVPTKSAHPRMGQSMLRVCLQFWYCVQSCNGAKHESYVCYINPCGELDTGIVRRCMRLHNTESRQCAWFHGFHGRWGYCLQQW